jgi:F0F1-type ATP synthase assembly protein I
MDDERFRREIAALKAREKELRSSNKQQTESTEESQNTSNAMRYTWLGAEFAAIFFGFVWGGRWLDAKLGTNPWLVLSGICIGFSIALYRLIFVARKLGEADDQKP